MGNRRFRNSYRSRNRKRRVNRKTRKFKRRTRAEFNKNYILNLSRKKLSQDEILLLSKGTKFIPCPNTKNIRKNVMMDFFELQRKMRCRFHYNDNSVNKDIHPLYQKTGHVPPMGNDALENYLTDTLFEINRLEVKPFRDNLSKNERKSLKKLIGNPELIVSKADKNNPTVIMCKNNYIKAGNEHLHSKYYAEIKQPSTDSISQEIKGITKRLFCNKEIDLQTFNFS